MRLLLDTHIFLWWYDGAPQLPADIGAAILDPTNEVIVSAVVVWEIVVKRSLGKLDFAGSVIEAIEGEGFKPLSVVMAHAEEVAQLPRHHRDPFDRLLVAQARREGLVLATVDPLIHAYDGFAVLGNRRS